MKRYRCKICGYEFEGDSLDSTYHCPMCDASYEQFVLVEEPEDKRIPLALDNPAIMRIMEKCINCGRCKDICQNVVGIKYDINKAKCPVCVNCGQCILNCPVGALVPKYHYKRVLDYIHDTDKTVIVSTSPAVRVALGEEFGMTPGSFVEGQMVTALKKLGFDYVLDTTFGADLTVMEEASELLERLKSSKKLPQFTSCCPAWVKYMEIYHSHLLEHLSNTKSPIGIQGTIIKTYFCEKLGLNPADVIHVALTPCTAKKFEITKEELKTSGEYNHDNSMVDTDFVITTSEMAMMIRENNIDFKTLPNGQYDSLLSRGSGSGVIFGSSGGVMEATLRTVYYLLTKKSPPKDLLQLNSVRGYENIREATIKILDYQLKVAVVHGLPNVEVLLKKLENGNLDYDFIEVMNCIGGCVGGGGQPLVNINKQDEIRQKRKEALYAKDATDSIRNSYENPDIKEIYHSFLKCPLSSLSKKLLHTTYTSKHDILGDEPININN